MSLEVAGIPSSEFSDPIRVALGGYADLADGRYSFDLDGAVRLDYVLGKLTARSVTDIMHGDEKVADLTVIAFAPDDGTGDDKTFTADQLNLGGFPNDKRYFPRSKVAAHSEAHLTLASKHIDTPDDPALFAGHLSVIGICGENYVAEVGYVGQESHAFAAHLPVSDVQRGHPGLPTATLTTGYKRGLSTPVDPGERFGDPHAIVNRVRYAVQVAGFIAISPDMAPKHLELLRLLQAREFQPYP